MTGNTSSVATTIFTIKIISSLGRRQNCKNYHHISPFCFPSGGTSSFFPSLLAMEPSAIHSHWRLHALCYCSELPSTSQHHHVIFHPSTTLLLQPCLG